MADLSSSLAVGLEASVLAIWASQGDFSADCRLPSEQVMRGWEEGERLIDYRMLSVVFVTES